LGKPTDLFQGTLDLSTASALIQLACGDMLTLVHHTSGASVTLNNEAGGTATNANAAITIMKIAARLGRPPLLPLSELRTGNS
jgi:hypothetical protein